MGPAVDPDGYRSQLAAGRQLLDDRAPASMTGTFDDEVFQVLSEMVDNPTYWSLNREHKKLP